MAEIAADDGVGIFDVIMDNIVELEFEDGMSPGEIYVRRDEEREMPQIDENNPENNGNDDDGANSDEEREENFRFINGQKSKSTLAKTGADVRRFQQYLRERGEERLIEEIEVRRLDGYMSSYFRELKRQDGGEYEPDSITAILGSFDRYLREKGYKTLLMESAAFKGAREMVEAKKHMLKASGKGNKPNKSTPLTDGELEKLWTQGGFGTSSPEELIAAVWFSICLHFGFRANHECRQLKNGDIEIKTDEEGTQYLDFTERLSKTRQGLGGGAAGTRAFSPKAWSTGGPRCPVFLFQEYLRHKPTQMTTPEAVFFCTINHKRSKSNPIWFSRAPLGHNEIGKILQKAGVRCGIERKLTNHSVRKTSISTLVSDGIPFQTIAQHSGHKNPDSIRHYATANISEQKKMSLILSKRTYGNILPSTSRTETTTKEKKPSLASKEETLMEYRQAGVSEAFIKKQQAMFAAARRKRVSVSALPESPAAKIPVVWNDSSDDEMPPSRQPSNAAGRSDDVPTQVYSRGNAIPYRETTLVDHEYAQVMRSQSADTSDDSDVEIPPPPSSQVLRLENKKSEMKNLLKGMFTTSSIRGNTFNINFNI